MNQPPFLTNIKRMRLIYREIEHLFGLLDGKHVEHGAGAAIGFLQRVAGFQVSGTDPLATQPRVSSRCGPGLGRGGSGQGEGIICLYGFA